MLPCCQFTDARLLLIPITLQRVDELTIKSHIARHGIGGLQENQNKMINYKDIIYLVGMNHTLYTYLSMLHLKYYHI